MIPASSHIMDLGEIDTFEKALQTSFPLDDLHVLIDTDARAEVWSSETALGVKWTSVNPTQLVGLPESVTPRKLSDVLYEMVLKEVEKALETLHKEIENGV